MNGRHKPFQNLGPRERRNLALAAVFALYAAYIGVGIYRDRLFTAIGTDYIAFWSAGYLANTEGHARAYDLEALLEAQAPWIPKPPDPSIVLVPIPAPVLPVFLLLFRPFALLPADWSLLIWTVLNVLLLAIYLPFFVKRTAAELSVDRWPLVAMMLSFPVFWNLTWGQVNFLLLVCIGEFLRAMIARKPFRAGLWLGGLWLKPQTLILLIPALLLQRSWRTLAGFAAASVVLVGVSIGIGGLEAMRQMVELWLGYASGLPTNDPQRMVNWRMVGIHISALLGPGIGWGIALVGLALTVLAALSLWLRPLSLSSPKFGIVLLGTLAATCATTWHSHPHMMVSLIPPMLYLIYRRRIPSALVDLWLFSFPALMDVGFILDLVEKSRILPYMGLMITGNILAFAGFGVNLYLLFWTVRSVTALEREHKID